MWGTRDTSGAEPSRADAAARRLALLAADLALPAPPALPDDVTRVVAARSASAAPITPAPPVPELGPEPAAVHRPGRHAARRRPARPLSGLTGVPRLPGLGAPQLAVLAVVVAVGVALGAWWVVRQQATPVTDPAGGAPVSAEPLVPVSTAAAPAAASSTATVTVDVTGRVRRPGIVVLEVGARVVDALEAAGGERAGVDLSTLNLARVLVDGEQIVVGVRAAAVPGVPAAPSGAAVPDGPATLVNLNTATQAELETLPDVGPVTAAAILAWRDHNGGFTSVDELLEVDGIGEVTLQKLAPYVTV